MALSEINRFDLKASLLPCVAIQIEVGVHSADHRTGDGRTGAAAGSVRGVEFQFCR